MERCVPPVTRARRSLEAQLESDASEDERYHHDEDREIKSWQDNGEGEWKGGKQSKPAEHGPGLVAIPDRRNRVHYEVAMRSRAASPGARRNRMPTPRSNPSISTY